MKIAVTADPLLPVPPVTYGGIERVIDLLVCGLTERGHDVTLFAHPESRVPCRLVPYRCDARISCLDPWRHLHTVASELRRRRHDVVHSFGRLAYLTTLLPLSTPKLMTYQRRITRRTVALAWMLSRGTLEFSAPSRHMMATVRRYGRWHLVHNGVREDLYQLSDGICDDAPLVFLGRVEEIKGAHVAIEVARRTGRRLLIAGNIPDAQAHVSYFRNRIAPWVDGDRVEYLGPVDDGRKRELLGNAAALLMPVLWDEPFGIVMAEALACGTPVIGFDRGSVPEVVEEGVTGFVCGDVEEMVDAVGRLGTISRVACRRSMEQRFSATAIVDAYESLYRTMLRTRRATGAGE